MSFTVGSLPPFETAAEALAAWAKATGPRQISMDGQELVPSDLEELARQEAAAPDPEEEP